MYRSTKKPLTKIVIVLTGLNCWFTTFDDGLRPDVLYTLQLLRTSFNAQSIIWRDPDSTTGQKCAKKFTLTNSAHLKSLFVAPLARIKFAETAPNWTSYKSIEKTSNLPLSSHKYWDKKFGLKHWLNYGHHVHTKKVFGWLGPLVPLK